jgi:hypothetical protein
MIVVEMYIPVPPRPSLTPKLQSDQLIGSKIYWINPPPYYTTLSKPNHPKTTIYQDPEHGNIYPSNEEIHLP